MTTSTPDPDHHSSTTMPGDPGNGTTKQKLEEDARDAKQEVGARVREKAEGGQHRLAEEADSLSDAIDAAASNLDDHDREGLARYARELSSNLASAAGQLESRSVDELAQDAKRLARNNPSLFMLGSIAVGFGLSRFFKASAQHDPHNDENTRPTDSYQNDDTVRSDDFSTGTRMQERDRDMTEKNTTSTVQRSGEGSEML